MRNTIISGVIILIFGAFVIDPIKEFLFPEKADHRVSPKREIEPINEVIPSHPEPPRNNNKFIAQSYSTIEIFEGNLNITLNNMVEYSNQKINIAVSATGKPKQNFEGMSLGDKVVYEGYEIIFIDTKNNISTYDVWLKVVPLN